MKKLFTLLTLALISIGSAWGQKFSFDYNSNNSVPTNAGTGTAVATSSDTKVLFAKEKGNGCMKFQSTISSSNQYFTLTPTSTLETGDEITIGNYITNSSADKYAQLTIEYYSNTDTKLATQTAANIVGNGGTNVLTSAGTPIDEVLIVPAAANGAKYIRIGRGTGNTNLFVSKFIIASGSPTLTGTWTKNSDEVDKNESAPTLPAFSVSATKNEGDLTSSHYSVAYSLKVGSTDGILTINPSTGITAISTATIGTATCVATVTSTNEATYKTPATNTFEYSVTVNDLICATPTFTTYGHAFQIACATSDATIYYTIDGSTPTTSSEQFTLTGNNLMALPTSGTVKAIAAKDGYANSSVASETITVPTVGSTTGNLLVTLQPDAVVDGDDFTYTSGFSKADYTMTNNAASKGIQLTDKMEKYPYAFKAASGKITITPPADITIQSVKVYAIKNSNKSAGNITVGDGYIVTSSSNVVIPRYAYNTEGDGVMSEIVLTKTTPVEGETFEFTIGSQFRMYVEVYGTTSATTETITPAKEYTTYIPTHNLNFTGLDIKAYVATAATSSSVTLAEVTTVPAGTPLVLKKGSAASYDVPVVASASAPASNLLKAGDGTTSIGGDSKYDYILSDGLFYRLSPAGVLPAGKAYLHLAAEPAAGREFLEIEIDGYATGIKQMEDVRSKKDDVYYDLQGRRVLYPTKGLYIVNGKKVIVK